MHNQQAHYLWYAVCCTHLVAVCCRHHECCAPVKPTSIWRTAALQQLHHSLLLTLTGCRQQALQLQLLRPALGLRCFTGCKAAQEGKRKGSAEADCSNCVLAAQ